jgi:hypothetical protein
MPKLDATELLCFWFTKTQIAEPPDICTAITNTARKLSKYGVPETIRINNNMIEDANSG